MVDRNGLTNNLSPIPQAAVQPPPLPLAPRRTSWPVVFGVGAIAFGVLGVLASLPAGCAGGLASIALPAASQGDKAMQDIQSMAIRMAIFSWLSVALSIAMLIGGAGLCRRRVWSVKLFWIWSLVNLLVTAIAAVAGYRLCRQMLGSLQTQRGDLALNLSDADVATFALVMAVAVLLIGWSSPIFLMIWFARRSVREEVAGWA